ncbi:T9SS type A sorting domain-containing protein [Candidatus Gottesmanbacteria bacterium]|nr:T9SS type A sorting domain-containing protein [Candidatus Gottesmanbacteria bacterium]
MMLSSNATEDGLIRISFVSLNGLRSNILAKIEFDVISDKITALNIQKADLYRSDALPIESKLINGVFRSWAIPAKDNELLQNFPNPFNPETWIPYQLKVKSYVTILISSSNGNLVREIKLGDKMAGTYSTKDRAAYWDGKSEEGEYVSNGIYFYTIKAGDFVATRKMVIMK